MPARSARSFTAKIFSNGGLPSKIAVACARKSGSARKIAATGKLGTKMQANIKQYLVPSTQYRVVSCQTVFQYRTQFVWPLATDLWFFIPPRRFCWQM